MSPEGVVALLVALILGISVHEFSHALAATWLGDTLPRRQGRLTLAPTAHLDVMGSLMFLIGGFGWGKPVQYNPYALRAGPRSGPALVALAGPISNIILATIFAVPTRILILTASGSFSAPGLIILVSLLDGIVYYNLILGFFNLIPVFPLDGFSILLGILPPELAYQYERTRPWGILILLALLFFGGSLLGPVLYEPVALLHHVLTGL
ncbi:MAG: site-2 protease family protein [Chloroflexi bacterium]|nr:site-2 protease family protein [Chloroflexota bacterium]